MACKPQLSNACARGLVPTRTNRKVSRIPTLIGAASFLLLGLGLAHAQNTYTVTTTSGNSGDGCTGSSPTFECADLLDAIGSASAGDTINFSVSGTIYFSDTVNSVGIGNPSLTIDGTGQNITISGGAANFNGGAFVINGGATVNLNALTFSGNDAALAINDPSGYGGGAIYNSGTLNITNSTFTQNSSSVFGFGGAIFNVGTLTVANSNFSGNFAAEGGAIYSSGPITISNTVFSGNSGGFAAGAIFEGVYCGSGTVVPGTVAITDSTFSGNSSGNGGAVYIDNCGGIAYDPALNGFTVTNSTFIGNSGGTLIGSSRSLYGGAISLDGELLTVTNSTFLDNTAQSGAAGGAIATFSGTATLYNTILAGGGSNGNCATSANNALIVDGGGNLSDDASCAFTLGTSQNGVTTLNLAAALADNPTGSITPATPTIALGPNSAASGSGVTSVCAASVASDGASGLDQRGVSRPAAACSSGAFQYVPLTLTCPSSSAQVGVPYSSALLQSGGISPYTLSLTGSLPAGLSLNSSTGAISGLPTTPGGPINFTGSLTDSSGFASETATAACSITVQATQQITVPSVVGSTEAAAATAISGAGLVLGTVTMASSSTVAPGNVISETPAAGAQVAAATAVNLVVSSGPAPSFTLQATSSSVSLVQGQSGNDGVSVTALNGFTGAVSFSATGLPAGVTASFAPTSSTSGTTLTLTAASTATVGGPVQITIVGTSVAVGSAPAIAATTPVNVTITAALKPQTITFATIPAQTIGTPLGLSASASSNLPVSYTAGPSNVCSVAGNTANFGGTGSCTIIASAAGNTVYAAATPVQQTFMVVAAPSPFSLKPTANPLTLQQNTGGTDTIGVIDAAGFSGAVTLSVSGAPTGVNTAFAGNVLIVFPAATVPTGTYPLTISGVSGAAKVTTTLNLVITAAASFNLTPASPSVSVTAGASGTDAIGITPIAGFANTVSFSATGLPTGARATFSPVSSVSGTTLTLSAAATTLPGSYPIVITGSVAGTGNSNPFTESTQVTLVVTAALKAQTISFAAIGSQKVGIPLALSASASSGLAVSYSASPASVCKVTGSTATFLSPGTCTITASQAGNGTYAAAPSVSHSFTVGAATVGAFALTPTAATVTVTPPVCILVFCTPAISATDAIGVAPSGGFTGPVTFTISGLPTGVSAAFSPASVTTSGSSTLTLTPSSSAARGQSTKLTITGVSGSLSAYTTVTLNY